MTTIYTVDELAAHWKCSRDIVYDLLTRKKLAGFKLGSAWRISCEAVENFENGK